MDIQKSTSIAKGIAQVVVPMAASFVSKRAIDVNLPVAENLVVRMLYAIGSNSIGTLVAEKSLKSVENYIDDLAESYSQVKEQLNERQ